MSRFVLVVAYDGAPFHGWQTQPSGMAVQDVLENALSKVADQAIKVVCAGRTDTGVHALAQIVHCDLPDTRPETAWFRGVNALLPASVQVKMVCHVDSEFHARFDAIERSYRYLIYRSASAHPLLSGRAGWVFRPLDIQKMEVAARTLLGQHDFSSFRSSQCQANSPVRELKMLRFREQGAVLAIEFKANAFLHHMIRNIVGALVEVGTEKRDLAWFESVFKAKDRRLGAATFAPDGLYFLAPTYSSDKAPEQLRAACAEHTEEQAQWWY
jgi:tRNA pseudouridine38-40 synthase